MSDNAKAATALDQEAWSFATDPVSFFQSSHTSMQDIGRKDLEALQMRALQLRFAALKDAIPMLQKLADRQGITELSAINDVVPLLFEHTMFKSYPPVLLEKGRFGDLTNWLNKLTSEDLSRLDTSDCQSIDEWIAVLDRDTSLRICHSSGTSGTMSFLPSAESNWDLMGRSILATHGQPYGKPKPERQDYTLIMPFFSGGARAHDRINEAVAKHLADGSPGHVMSVYPGKFSSDVLYLSARVRAAHARGDLDRVVISPALLARKREFELVEAEMPAHLDRFLEMAPQKLRGRPIFVSATWNLLHRIAAKGLAKGVEAISGPGSIVASGGGSKGITQPDKWEADVCRFFGVGSLSMAYGMSEIAAHHLMCSQGHYHFTPWVIPIVLDPESGKALPRSGVTTGRAAFFDLTAHTRWGGFISGDEVTVHWDGNCPCGRRSARIVGGIQRYSEKNGGDDKITCSATEGAHKEAMSFLNTFE